MITTPIKTKHPDALALGAQRKLLPAGGEARQAVPADTVDYLHQPQGLQPGRKIKEAQSPNPARLAFMEKVINGTAKGGL